MLAVARPSAMVLTLRAPLTPSFLMLRNTVTTSKFKGMPKRFMITDL